MAAKSSRPTRPLFIAAAFVAIYVWNAPTTTTLHSHRERASGDATNRRESRARRDGGVGSAVESPAEGESPFVVDESTLERLRGDRPAVVAGRREEWRRRAASDGDDEFFDADVVSVGSETRLHYLRGQVETWSSHADVRHFWGFAEQNDYDANCTAMTKEEVAAHVKRCRSSSSSRGWEDAEIERFAANRFGETENGLRHEAGWLCAQRRAGRALGWIHRQYRNNNDTLPDVLALVDDDTSLDVGNLKRMIIKGVGGLKEGHGPLVYAGCYYPKTPKLDVATTGWPYATPHGGFGTYFSRRAVRLLVRPIFCDKDGEREKSGSGVCVNLKRNRIGERRVFREGMSTLELFYGYSALRDYCMHSDWLVGYMINFYLHPLADSLGDINKGGSSGGEREILRVNPPLCGNVTDRRKVIHCTSEYTTCHRQTPQTMEHWAVTAFVRAPRDYWRIPRLQGTEFVMGNRVPKFDP